MSCQQKRPFSFFVWSGRILLSKPLPVGLREKPGTNAGGPERNQGRAGFETVQTFPMAGNGAIAGARCLKISPSQG